MTIFQKQAQKKEQKYDTSKNIMEILDNMTQAYPGSSSTIETGSLDNQIHAFVQRNEASREEQGESKEEIYLQYLKFKNSSM